MAVRTPCKQDEIDKDAGLFDTDMFSGDPGAIDKLKLLHVVQRLRGFKPV